LSDQSLGRKRIDYRIEESDRPEIAVREAFAKYHKELGYPKILISRDRFPDYLLEGVQGKKIRAEVKVYSESAKAYENLDQECDLVICWYDNWDECPVPKLELSRHIDEPLQFKGLEEQELGALKSSNLLQSAIEGIRTMLKDVEDFVYSRDTEIPYSKYQAEKASIFPQDSIYFRHKNSEGCAAELRINLLTSSTEIIGRITKEVIFDIAFERWKDLFTKVSTLGFSSRAYAEETGDISDENVLLERLTKPQGVEWVEFFRSYDLVEGLQRKPEEVVERIGSSIIRILQFMDEEALFTSQTEPTQ